MNKTVFITALLSLIALGCNILFFNSLLLGVIIAPIYLFIVSLLCGNALFPQESQRFRIFYGFIVFFCLLVVLGTIAYWIHALSNLPILVILFVLTVSLICLNWNRSPLLSLAGIKLKKRITELNLGVLDFFFLAMVGLSFYFLFAARTGESIPPPWTLVPSQFFICLILATALLLIKIWRAKSPSGLLLFYTILLILIPAFGFQILMHQPYATMKGAQIMGWDLMFTEFGRLTMDPTLPEAARCIIGKGIIEVGQPIGDVFLIKLLQVPPLYFGLCFVPILFTLMVVLAPFDLMRSLTPRQKGLALVCSLSFLATQHNIHLFTPPGKNETLALGLLMVSVMLWVKFLQGQRFRWASFTAPVILLIAILVIHQLVGLFALFLAVLALSLFLLKPFQGSLFRSLSWVGLSIGFVFIGIYGYPYLNSLASYVVGFPLLGGADIRQFNLSEFIGTVAPPLWSREGLGIFQGIFYTFINNSVYVIYALIILGTIAAFRYKLNKNWLAINFSLVVLAFAYFSVMIHLYMPTVESYRFFYYLNFLAFPLVGVGLYWLANSIVGLRAWISTTSKGKEKFISLKPLQLAICGLLLASLFTSSIWAGYPRPDSMGYQHPNWQIRYPSDYDVAALDFIEATEGDNRNFFIVGDGYTCSAGYATVGNWAISTAEGYVSIFSFYIGEWGYDEFFNLAAEEPTKYLVEGTDYTNRLVDKTYLIFTYRLGIDRLKSLVNFYSEYLGKPIYAVEDKAYVFSYDREQIATLLSQEAEEQLILFDDELVEDKFWRFQLIGKGNLTFNISDNTEVKKRGNSCLQFTISPGEYERATMWHVWDEPLDFSQAKYLLLFVYGSDSEGVFNIYFRSVEPASDNFFYYTVRDNFRGWNLLVIPLKSFEVGGSPSWQVVSEMVIQAVGRWSPGELYFDQISVVKEPSLQSLYEESVINLP